MQLSNIVGKQLLSTRGQTLGVCIGAYASRNLGKLTALVCANDEDEQFYLSPRAVKNVGDVILATYATLKSPAGIPVPVRRAAYSHEGEFLGLLSDVVWDEQPKIVLVKEGVSQSISQNKILVGETLIVYPTEAPRKATRPRAKKRPTRVRDEIKDDIPVSEPTLSAQSNKIALDLIGRTLTRPLYAPDGTLLGARGDVVTPALIRSARRQNKMLQLTVTVLSPFPL